MSVDYRVGDTREVIKGIADGSVDLIASSPPFLALRSYVPAGHESKGDEIGSERNPAEFIDMLLGLTAEWGRVLAAHGSIAIELGDTYAGSGGGGGDYLPGGLRENQPGFGGSAERQKAGNAAHWRAKNQTPDAWPRAKSLALIPQLYAVALAYGINPLTGAPSPAGRWLVRNVIVWHRPNPAVGALGDKVRPSTSYIIVATRSAKRWFDLTAVRSVGDRTSEQPFVTARHTASTDAMSKPFSDKATGSVLVQNPAGAPPLDCWFDTYDGTHDTTTNKRTPAELVAVLRDLAECEVDHEAADLIEQLTTDHYDGTHDTWTLTTQPSRLAHYAMWPAKLAERLILSMCPREVCRVCSEPRRRIEGVAEYVNDDGSGRDELDERWRHGRVGLNGDALQKAGHLTRTARTLGWTDCGCICPTCNSSRWSAGDDNYASGGSPCPDCYRPGLTLDPFAGSGTTLAVADLHGRDAIGIDFDARNKAIYPARYDEVKRALFGTPAPMPGQETFDFEEVAG